MIKIAHAFSDHICNSESKTVSVRDVHTSYQNIPLGCERNDLVAILRPGFMVNVV